MKQPKFSEVLRAAARGVMEPYGGGQQSNTFQQAQNMGGISASFSSADYAAAKQMAGIFHAIADVYDSYEKGSPE